MKKILLLTYCSLMSCQTVANSYYCSANTDCQPNKVCDLNTHGCVDALSITNISPRKGDQLGGSPVTITGIGFTDSTTVQIGGLGATVTAVTATELTVLAPASAVPCLPLSVRVTRPDGATAEVADGFQYTSTRSAKFTLQTPYTNQTHYGAFDQILVEDVNGDSRGDLILKIKSTVYVCAGTAQGLDPCYTLPVAAVDGESIMLVHKFNGNKYPDILLVPKGGAPRSGAIFHNLGTGMAPFFNTSNTYDKLVPKTTAVLPIDSADGVTSLWTATSDSTVLNLTYGTTPDTATPTLAKALLGSLLLARTAAQSAGPQLVGIQPLQNTVTILVPDPSSSPPTFSNKVVMTALNWNSVQVGDVNGDGQPDLVGTAAMTGTATNQALYVAFGDDTGNYTVPTSPTASFSSTVLNSQSTPFAIADLGCSGTQGILYKTDQGVTYIEGHTTKVFGPPVLEALSDGSNVALFAVKDVTGDGRPDFVFTTSLGVVGVAVNTQGP